MPREIPPHFSPRISDTGAILGYCYEPLLKEKVVIAFYFFLHRPALLTTHHCSLMISAAGNQFAVPANKNKCAHRAAVALQTFLPCFKFDFPLGVICPKHQTYS